MADVLVTETATAVSPVADLVSEERPPKQEATPSHKQEGAATAQADGQAENTSDRAASPTSASITATTNTAAVSDAGAKAVENDAAKGKDQSTAPPQIVNGGAKPQHRSRSREQDTDAMKRRVFVGNIGRQCTEEDIRQIIGDQFGKVESIHIIRDHATRASKGYGFILFSTEKEARQCLIQAEQAPMHFHQRQLNFREARRRERGASDPSRRRPRPRHRHASVDSAMHAMYPPMFVDPNNQMMHGMDMHMYEMMQPQMYMPMQNPYGPAMMNGRPGMVSTPSAGPPFSPIYAYNQPEQFAFPSTGMMPQYMGDQPMAPPPPSRFQGPPHQQQPQPQQGFAPNHQHQAPPPQHQQQQQQQQRYRGGMAQGVDETMHAMAGMNLNAVQPPPPQTN